MQKAIYPSLLGQMAYVIGAGLALIFFPNVLLGIFGLPEANEIWIRIMGLLVLTLSIYYYFMAYSGNDIVTMATVYGRLFFCTGLIIFVILGMAETPLIGFAFFEIGLAMWTWRELKGKK